MTVLNIVAFAKVLGVLAKMSRFTKLLKAENAVDKGRDFYKAVDVGKDAESAYRRVQNAIKKCFATGPSLINKLLGGINASAGVCDLISDITNFRLSSTTNIKRLKVKPDFHYAKHGHNDLVSKGFQPVSQQKYFDDAERFINRYEGGQIYFEKTIEQVPRDPNIVGTVVYKIKDPNTGLGGFVSNLNELISFWYE
jgi:hypothetical protein